MRFEAQAIKNSWSAEQLRAALNENSVGRVFVPDGRDHSGGAGGRISARRGRLYTYRVLEADVGGDSVKLDLGFNVRRSVPVEGEVSVGEGELVESFKDAHGSYSFKSSGASSGDQYTYAAAVEKVVDGDTLWVVAELGFDVEARCKLRLHALNTPELDTQKGRDAKKYVEQKLTGCSFIVIRTFGTDKYARYLADVYTQPGEKNKQKVAREGKFLNQMLIDEGHAVRV